MYHTGLFPIMFWQIARAAAIFKVDEIIIFDEQGSQEKSVQS